MMRRALSAAEGLLGSPVRNLAAILLLMTAVVIAATSAYMAAGWSFADAFYMVILTVYTVGYDEVRPIDTPYLHVVTLGTIVLGCTGMILFTSVLVQFSTGLQLRQMLGGNRMQHGIDKLSRHVIVCGFGRIGVMLARDLADGGMPLVVVDQSADRLREAESAGHLCLAGDATDDVVLVAAGIARARVLASVLPNDAANVFIALSARNLNPGVEIIARGEAPSTETKLRHAGANHVVLPTHIGAERIARMILHPRAQGMDSSRLSRLAEELEELGLHVGQVAVVPGSAGVGLTRAEAERHGGEPLFIVRVERDSEGRAVPTEDPIEAGDRISVVARDGGSAARRLFASPSRAEGGPVREPGR